ncbi:hypothetical protein MNBD_GAMMA20-501 [hydrothermal vent metagenome]|uniref:Uncharacterized protein n=1 Tax=hydrothermal vent metagenome TaxID=652676 RepID=A0A3B1AFG2_9ZZZZ
MVNQAIEQMLEMQAWQVERIEEGIKAADEDRFADDAEMARIFYKYKDSPKVTIQPTTGS